MSVTTKKKDCKLRNSDLERYVGILLTFFCFSVLSYLYVIYRVIATFSHVRRDQVVEVVINVFHAGKVTVKVCLQK